MSRTSVSAEGRVAVRGNPRLARAIGILGLWDLVVFFGIAFTWGISVLTIPGIDLRSAGVACAAAALILSSAWFGIARAARAQMELMMAWVGGSFIVRVFIVGATVIAAHAIGSQVRWIALSVVAALICHTGVEIWVLSRSHISHVVPLSADQ